MKIESQDPNQLTAEIVAANGQAADIVRIKNNAGTTLWYIDKDGNARDLNYNEPARYTVWYDSETLLYKAKDNATNRIIASDDSADELLEAIITYQGTGELQKRPAKVHWKANAYSTSPQANNEVEHEFYITDGQIHNPHLTLSNAPCLTPKRVISLFEGGVGVETYFSGTLGVDYMNDTTNNIWGTQGAKCACRMISESYLAWWQPHYSAPLDLSEDDGEFVIRFKITGTTYNPTTDKWGTKGWDEAWMRIQSNGTSWAAGPNWAIQSCYITSGTFPNRSGAWHEITVNKDAFTYDSGETNFDWGHVTEIRMDYWIAPETLTPPTDIWTTLNYLGWHTGGRLTRPVISLRQDDSASGLSNWEKSLDRYGLAGMIAIPEDGGGLYTSDVKRLHSKGWDVVMHGWWHDDFGSKSAVSEAKSREQCRDAIRWLTVADGNGLLGKYRWVCQPGGGGDCYGAPLNLSKYFHASMNGVGAGGSPWPPASWNSLRQEPTAPSSGVAYWKGKVDAIVSKGSKPLFYTWYWHPADNTMSQSDVNEVVDYILANGIEIKTLSQMADEFGL